jgi:hypothetical protein
MSSTNIVSGALVISQNHPRLQTMGLRVKRIVTVRLSLYFTENARKNNSQPTVLSLLFTCVPLNTAQYFNNFVKGLFLISFVYKT